MRVNLYKTSYPTGSLCFQQGSVITSNFKVINWILLFSTSWLTFHLVFIWYFQTFKCSYFSEFWLAYGNSIKSPLWAFFLVFSLFLLQFITLTYKARKQSKKIVFLWCLLTLAPASTLYGLYNFNQFMVFQNSNLDISEYMDINSLTGWQKDAYEFKRNYHNFNKDNIVNKWHYCEAIDFYKIKSN